MTVRNVHERVLGAPAERVGALLDSLSSTHDRLWPAEKWPRIRFDNGLVVGSRGGHGPVRYFIEACEPGRRIIFRFTGPRGFAGTHGFEVVPHGSGAATLRHALELEPAGPALVTWPVFFRPLHDALIEDLLDKAEHELLGRVGAPQRWSRYVRLLRWIVRGVSRRLRGHHETRASHGDHVGAGSAADPGGSRSGTGTA